MYKIREQLGRYCTHLDETQGNMIMVEIVEMTEHAGHLINLGDKENRMF